MKSIKKRIYKQNGIVIISIILFLEGIFFLAVKNYYIEVVRNELFNKVNTAERLYNKYFINQTIYEKAKYILENESNNELVYMQVFDSDGNVIINSNGIKNDSITYNEDIKYALQGEHKIVKWENKETKENLMAISMPLYHLKDISGGLRYVICIDKVNKMILYIYGVSILIGIVVMIITFLFSSFLAKSIIVPINKIISTAEVMSKGDFTQKAEKIHNDEIGKLSDTLNYMAEEIEKSNNLKNEFISSISHELRTPLTAIKGWSEIMVEGEVTEPKEIKEGLIIINDETERLTSLVEELLDFSKLQGGKVELNLQAIDINELVKKVYNYFKKRCECEGLNLILDLCENSCVVNGDSNRLKQVFINIIDNAIKFSKKGEKIFISTHLCDNFVQIHILDNGIGISKDELKKVTEKFYKGKTKKSGSGLGLAICKEIIELHKGKLDITSKEQQGTKVSIKIPF
ncbi:ATP-binding protein [Haloimpatiens sp. FM7330]|uniref:ATP-binding protein n=1 Tax=Haloimpatiens sp. FM7330 TaxID=3298610 RepID=UPI0036324E04